MIRIPSLFLSLFLLMGATPVAAQDILYSNDATRACLVGKHGAHARAACIGTSATACMDASHGGFTNPGMAGCLNRELRYWDDVLNRTYQRMLQTDGANKLRSMQRAWIAFRDARCAHAASYFSGGSAAGPVYGECLLHMTAEQALYLKSIER